MARADSNLRSRAKRLAYCLTFLFGAVKPRTHSGRAGLVDAHGNYLLITKKVDSKKIKMMVKLFFG